MVTKRSQIQQREIGQVEFISNNSRLMEPTIGLEPMTCALRMRCSTTELRRHDSRCVAGAQSSLESVGLLLILSGLVLNSRGDSR